MNVYYKRDKITVTLAHTEGVASVVATITNNGTVTNYTYPTTKTFELRYQETISLVATLVEDEDGNCGYENPTFENATSGTFTASFTAINRKLSGMKSGFFIKSKNSGAIRYVNTVIIKRLILR